MKINRKTDRIRATFLQSPQGRLVPRPTDEPVPEIQCPELHPFGLDEGCVHQRRKPRERRQECARHGGGRRPCHRSPVRVTQEQHCYPPGCEDATEQRRHPVCEQ